jgi:hypothetical protein
MSCWQQTYRKYYPVEDVKMSGRFDLRVFTVQTFPRRALVAVGFAATR